MGSGNTKGQRREDPILKKYTQENPELVETLNKSFEVVKGLRECLESGNLLPREASKGVEFYGRQLGNLTIKRKGRSTLSKLMIDLDLPKVVRDIFVTLRTQFPEASTWDRAPKDKKTDANAEAAEDDEQEQMEAVG